MDRHQRYLVVDFHGDVNGVLPDGGFEGGTAEGNRALHAGEIAQDQEACRIQEGLVLKAKRDGRGGPDGVKCFERFALFGCGEDGFPVGVGGASHD
ncbi:MAG: hypothetical protein R3B70_12320 [Polyangiaceae bacterium]